MSKRKRLSSGKTRPKASPKSWQDHQKDVDFWRTAMLEKPEIEMWAWKIWLERECGGSGPEHPDAEPLAKWLAVNFPPTRYQSSAKAAE